jgi:hypothetical protein
MYGVIIRPTNMSSRIKVWLNVRIPENLVNNNKNTITIPLIANKTKKTIPVTIYQIIRFLIPNLWISSIISRKLNALMSLLSYLPYMLLILT